MKKKFIFVFTACLLTLCSCGKKAKSYNFDKFVDKAAEYTVAENSINTYRQVKSSEGWQAMRSVGDARILVIPVDFPDYRCTMLSKYGGCEGVRSDLDKTYFGDSIDTKLDAADADPEGWESVSSFYKKSSFNKLNITGVVAPWYTHTQRVADLSSTQSSSGIVQAAVKNYKEYCEANEIEFNFDADEDGYIDCVQVIYSVPSQHLSQEIWWAYTSTVRGAMANFESPNVKQFVFASYDFMYSDPHYLDAHTYIHESGHVLGLEDYYNTTKGNTALAVRKPAGGIAMMDMNIGDHDGYSKFALNWTTPKVVTSEGSITIGPATTTGDAIIVSPNWKGTAFDEYLLIEYSRPIGLNQTDAFRHYDGNYPLVFSENGIKVYHIDSRLAKVNYPGLGFIEYVDSVVSGATFVTMLAHSNTPASDDSPALIHLLESSGKNTLYQGREATNEALFKVGDTFGAVKGKFNNFKFNSGLSLPFVFKVTNMTDEGATITFVKK